MCFHCQGHYQCECRSPWTGKNCTDFHCDGNLCHNSGICVDGQCVCSDGWSGADCSHPTTTTLPSKSTPIYEETKIESELNVTPLYGKETSLTAGGDNRTTVSSVTETVFTLNVDMQKVPITLSLESEAEGLWTTYSEETMAVVNDIVLGDTDVVTVEDREITDKPWAENDSITEHYQQDSNEKHTAFLFGHFVEGVTLETTDDFSVKTRPTPSSAPRGASSVDSTLLNVGNVTNISWVTEDSLTLELNLLRTGQGFGNATATEGRSKHNSTTVSSVSNTGGSHGNAFNHEFNHSAAGYYLNDTPDLVNTAINGTTKNKTGYLTKYLNRSVYGNMNRTTLESSADTNMVTTWMTTDGDNKRTTSDTDKKTKKGNILNMCQIM